MANTIATEHTGLIDMSDKSTNGFWDGFGFAMVILAICIGFGGCIRLMDDNPEPLIQPTIEIHLK